MKRLLLSLALLLTIGAGCASAAAPALRSDVAPTFATAANLTLTEPASCAANDIEKVDIYRESTSAITLPSGWSQTFNGTTCTIAAATAGHAFTHSCFWIRRGGSAPALTWTFASSFRAGEIACYSGAVTSGDPWSFVAVAVRDTTVAKTYPAVSGTTLAANELLIWAGYGFNTGGPGTPPTGFAEDEDAAVGIELAHLAQAIAGGTGSVSGASYSGGGNDTTTATMASLQSVAPAGGGCTAPPNQLMMLGVGNCKGH